MNITPAQRDAAEIIVGILEEDAEQVLALAVAKFALMRKAEGDLLAIERIRSAALEVIKNGDIA